MADYNRNLSWHTMFLCIATLVLALVSSSTEDIPPPRHIKLRGPPIGHPYSSGLKFQGKRIRGPVRVHHIHLNYPPPHQTRPFKYIPGPPRKYKPNIPIKSHFNPSPPAHFITPIIDNNEGAIHTIPAPNLGPNGDRPIPPAALVASTAGAVVQYDNAVKDLTYEVHESLYNEPPRGNIGLPYYAPDPDPSLPAPHVPVTRDPHSHPSNGKAPLDLILQQQLEYQQHNLAKVSFAPTASHLLTFQNDPNSQFLQAFQDQYKYQQAYDGEYQGSEVKNKFHEAPELDYDSGEGVRFSISSDHGYDGPQDQEDAASELQEEDEEILKDSEAAFGQRLKPKTRT